MIVSDVHGEEDIENTDIEYSSDNDSEEDAYDLSDSFIDDSPLSNHLNFPKIEGMSNLVSLSTSL